MTRSMSVVPLLVALGCSGSTEPQSLKPCPKVAIIGAQGDTVGYITQPSSVGVIVLCALPDTVRRH